MSDSFSSWYLPITAGVADAGRLLAAGAQHGTDAAHADQLCAAVVHECPLKCDLVCMCGRACSRVGAEHGVSMDAGNPQINMHTRLCKQDSRYSDSPKLQIASDQASTMCGARTLAAQPLPFFRMLSVQ